MRKSTPLLMLVAAALIVPTAAEADKGRRPASTAKVPKQERKQQTAFLKSQVNVAKATVARGKPVLKQAKADASAAAKTEAAARKARLASKARYDAALQEYRATGTPAAKQRMDAANIAHTPVKQAHEDALTAKRVADARVGRLSAQQTTALNQLKTASREARIGPNPGLRPRVAQWAQVRSAPTNAAVVQNPGVVYSQLPPAPRQQTQIYSNNGLNVPAQPPFSLPPPPPQFRQYDVVPPLLPADPRQRPLPPRPVRQNIYEAVDSPLVI